MMKRNNSYGGSASVVIIAILFIALMASLGVVFYQNFIAKPEMSQQTNTDNDTKTSTLKTERVAFGSTIYAFDYPDKGWKVTPVVDGSMSMVTFVNDKGTVRVNAMVSKTAVTTACNPSDGLQISYYAVSSTPVDKLVAEPLYVVASISDHKDGGYQYKIGLVPDGGDTHAAVGTTHCNIAHVGVASTALMNGKALVHPTVEATIDFPKLPGEPKPAAPDMQTLKDLMNTNDYKAAVKILESARKE